MEFVVWIADVRM